MLFRLAFWILRNTVTRTVLIFALAALAIVGGFGMADEAVAYKKGIQPASLENIPAKFKYDYVKLDADVDGNYVYFVSTNPKTKAEDYTLFYPAFNAKDGASDAAKPHATAIVKQVLSAAQEGCVAKEDCLESGILKLQGRITHAPFDVSEFTDDDTKKDVFDLLREDFTIDAKTVYVDANWTPSTSEFAGTVQLIGVGLLLAGLASFGIPLLLRRRALASPSA